MAKFIFSMQNVLNIKCKFEEQVKNEYSQALHKLHLEEEKLEMIENKRISYENKLRESVTEKLRIRTIKELQEGLEIIKVSFKTQQLIVKQEEFNVDKIRIQLSEAMKERKIYEKLKENAFEEFKVEVEKAEQKEVDELVSYKFRNTVSEERV